MLTAATTSTAGSGQSNATSETFTYNDRGLLLTATGSAGSTSYTWNGDGQQTSVADAAGHHQLHLRQRRPAGDAGRPGQRRHPHLLLQPHVAGRAGLLRRSGADTRSLGYDSLHRLTSDTLDPGSTTVASVSYGYNADGEV